MWAPRYWAGRFWASRYWSSPSAAAPEGAMWAPRYWAGRYWASRYWSSPSAAADAAALQAARTLTVTASGSLTTSIRLAGTPSLVVSCTANLTTAITLAAARSLTVTASGTLTGGVAIPLAGGATLRVTASGYLTTAPRIPTWPLTLPADFLVEGFSESAPETWVRTEMEVGVKKTRNRSHAGVSPITGSLSMTKVQIQALDDFFVTTLASGVLRFDWVDPRTQAPRIFRFTAVPVYEPIAPQVWRARVEVEVVP